MQGQPPVHNLQQQHFHYQQKHQQQKQQHHQQQKHQQQLQQQKQFQQKQFQQKQFQQKQFQQKQIQQKQLVQQQQPQQPQLQLQLQLQQPQPPQQPQLQQQQQQQLQQQQQQQPEPKRLTQEERRKIEERLKYATYEERREYYIREYADFIYYSPRYYDDISEYRHVTLPKEIAQFLPPNKLLSEDEWRSYGVIQSQGWEHYLIHSPEPHILLFKREKDYQLKYPVPNQNQNQNENPNENPQ